MLRHSIGISAVVVSAIFLAISCASASTEKSTGTNWIECHTDDDCASVPGATCGHRDYCVDGDGRPIAAAVAVSAAGTGGSAGGGNGGGSSPPGSGGSSGTLDCKASPQRGTDVEVIATVSGSRAQVVDGAVAGDGVGLLWIDIAENDETTLLFSRHQPGSGWGQPEQIVTNNGPSYLAQLARPVSPERPPVAVWAEGNGENTVLKAARRAEGGTWNPLPVILETADIMSYSAVADSTGNVTVVWTETDRGASDSVFLVRASRFLAGSTSWTEPEKLTTGADGGYIDAARVQILDDDSVVVLWSGSPSGWQTWSNVYDPAAKAWRGATQLSSKGEYRPSLSSSGNRALAVWAEQNASGPESLFAARYEAGRWSEASTVQMEAPGADEMTSAITPRGDALAVWQLSDPGEKLVYSAYRALDGTWAEPAVLEYPGALRPFPTSVTWVDCKQAFLAIWQEYDADAVHFAWYTLDGGWSDAVRHRPNAGLAVDNWGNLLTAWYDSDEKSLFFEALTP